MPLPLGCLAGSIYDAERNAYSVAMRAYGSLPFDQRFKIEMPTRVRNLNAIKFGFDPVKIAEIEAAAATIEAYEDEDEDEAEAEIENEPVE